MVTSAISFNMFTVYLPIRNEYILWTVVRLIGRCCPTSFSPNDKIGVTGVDVVLNVKIIRRRLGYWIVLRFIPQTIVTALKDVHFQREIALST